MTELSALNKNSIDAKINKIADSVATSALMDRPIVEWRPILAKECQVYVFGEEFIGKRFDQINYQFCGKDVARDILYDNLYALLRFKYFPKASDEAEERIKEIVYNITVNLKSSLIKVSFDIDTDAVKIKMIPDGCIAFRNGVYNFKSDSWLFKYNVFRIEALANNIYMYDDQYAIFWYMDFEFEPLPITIMSLPLEKFIDMMKDADKSSKNYCFELMYNMCHDFDDKFSMVRFKHLCEVLGYTCLQSFSQLFVLLIGSGQNGKNSLFDGCFTGKVVPRPASNDMDSIETDRFITGSLENKSHNIFLETSAKTYTESKMIKALTGSMFQTIELKGISKYSGIINCKYIFAGNDQEKIKFSDTTQGFKRRINIFETWYKWDSGKRFLSRGDYYDTTFNDSLSELKDNISNTIVFIYFAIYGMISGTNGFKKNFQFTENDWKLQYTDIDFDLKDRIEHISSNDLVMFLTANPRNFDEGRQMFFDLDGTRLYESPSIKELGYNNYDDLVNRLFKDETAFVNYFAEHDIYISIRHLQSLAGIIGTPMSFTQNIKKLYNITETKALYNNKPYIKATFINNRLRILSK